MHVRFCSRWLLAALLGAAASLLTVGGALAAPATGFDISYPQCGSQYPQRPAFAVLGVNGGLAFSGNFCLASEIAWAQAANSRLAFYLNTGNPGPIASHHWPAAGTSEPQPCDGAWNAACAYDYGWLAAADSFARAEAVVGHAAALSAPWWLDVESANSWSTDPATNAADLRGAVAYLQNVGVNSIGVYATANDWTQITGATSPASSVNDPFRRLFNWIPGAPGASAAQSYCGHSLTGGMVSLVQYVSGGFDVDLDCTG